MSSTTVGRLAREGMQVCTSHVCAWGCTFVLQVGWSLPGAELLFCSSKMLKISFTINQAAWPCWHGQKWLQKVLATQNKQYNSRLRTSTDHRVLAKSALKSCHLPLTASVAGIIPSAAQHVHTISCQQTRKACMGHGWCSLLLAAQGQSSSWNRSWRASSNLMIKDN